MRGLPGVKGEACDECHATVVMPARFAEMGLKVSAALATKIDKQSRAVADEIIAAQVSPIIIFSLF